MRPTGGSKSERTSPSQWLSCTRAWRGSKARHLMSLLDTFRSLPTAHLKLGMLPRWTSGLRSRLPSGLVSRRNPELLPAAAALGLFLIAGFQLTLPSSEELPDDTVLAPRRVVDQIGRAS